ncbi:hypothetical protein METBIDRAFT_33448 [Metschnikowia bicuspidata var. bicuspidata NRRL YB-4993]|uniref:Caffeine-induced death protein 2 n=1 Tax=Metschnikowia bicuspidata var. bicuspidata NRRL YB-4993 TaxID=869754 RepID=A0A1A0H5M5_9ASCO|nr:hypothetical protein METBIDRAFT_33448 [Metschnikowia bicuspidata var. bicuspidata NRRL YB-4993]OBA19250.1 hypothetical protein METBIDRAFT_33448 [Metschnikowia bicuspidata var. bicuspidata NRRL YB-4993]
MENENSVPEMLGTLRENGTTAASSSLLTPENCESSSRIRAFLRLSRIASDDTIRQHLNEINTTDCDRYFAEEIVPQWQARSEAILFCAEFARGLRTEAKSKESTINENYDLRVDPYALKNAHEILDNQYSRCVSVENWVANEANVESIVREQTAKVFSEKCYYKDWLKAFRSVTRNSKTL